MERARHVSTLSSIPIMIAGPATHDHELCRTYEHCGRVFALTPGPSKHNRRTDRQFTSELTDQQRTWLSAYLANLRPCPMSAKILFSPFLLLKAQHKREEHLFVIIQKKVQALLVTELRQEQRYQGSG